MWLESGTTSRNKKYTWLHERRLDLKIGTLTDLCQLFHGYLTGQDDTGQAIFFPEMEGLHIGCRSLCVDKWILESSIGCTASIKAVWNDHLSRPTSCNSMNHSPALVHFPHGSPCLKATHTTHGHEHTQFLHEAHPWWSFRHGYRKTIGLPPTNTALRPIINGNF